MNKSMLLLLSLTVFAGCLVVPVRSRPVRNPPAHSPPPPPPPKTRAEPRTPPPPPHNHRRRPPKSISQQEAISIAISFARSQGLRISRVLKVNVHRDGNYRVDLLGDHGHDRAKVLVNRVSGRVIRAKLRNSDPWND